MTEDHDDVFKALANRNRRRLLDRLRERDGQSQAELGAGLGISQQAVAQHLEILESASLVSTVREGREKLHYLNPVPIHAVADRWIRAFDKNRLRALRDLKRSVEGRHDE